MIMAPAEPTTSKWSKRQLSELLVVQNGFAFSSKKFSTTDGTPLIRIRDLNPGTGTKTRYLGEFDEQFLVHKGDLLIGMDGEFRCNIWKGPDALLNQRVCRLQNFSSDLIPKFLFYGINKYLKEIEDVTGFTTVKHLSSKSIKEIKFPLPPLAEQERIVGILDEAFEGIAAATAQAEKNLHNARELFQSVLQSTFSQKGDEWVETEGTDSSTNGQTKVNAGAKEITLDKNATKTGGRNATLRHIPGPLSLAVGMPQTSPRSDWRWSPLSDLARLESGHTPSRKHPEYWGGDVSWIGIKDARNSHGKYIFETLTCTNELGIENSSARILPTNTVCLSRTASVGYVLIMGRPMATSQDFVNWVCSESLNPEFLKYLFLAEGREGLLRYASGSVHQTIYFPEAKAFHICHPEIPTQQAIVEKLDALSEETKALEAIYERKQSALAELKQSLLQKAFAGEL